MKTLRLFPLILSVFAICQAGLGADAKADSNINQAKAALRARQYAETVVTLDKALGAKIKQADEALYLKGLALFYVKKYNACLKVCNTLREEHADSTWTHKGQFLKAAALVEKREFKQAEQIYEAAANRLLAEARKKDVAGVIIRFADALATKTKPDDLKSPPPNFNKAHKLYQQALAMEIGRALRDEVMFKGAHAVQQAGNHGQAINEFRAYLAEFDPDWTGNVGSVSRASGQKKEKPKAAGNNPLLARYHLAEAQLKAKQHNPSRVNFEDLLALIEKKKVQNKQAQLIADSRWQIIRTYRMPSPVGNDLDRAVKAAQGFLKEHPKDSRAVVAAYWIAQAYQNNSRPDQAIAAYGDFMRKKLHQLPEGDAATAKLDEFKKSPAELQDNWEKLALYRIGQLRYGQKKYDAAIESWQSYINKHPDGPNWANCQRGVINANFQTAIDAVSEKNYAKGKELFEAFLAKHPLDDRARQILFIFGQIEFEKARKLEEKRDDSKTPANARPKEEKIAQVYEGAIDRWNRLVSKYPNTEESSVALYRIGLIREEKLGDWKSALESYRRLAWGSKAGNSRMRVQLMTEKRLRLETERKFRTNEKALIKLDARNIKKVKVKQYFLDLEAYFRKTHQIGRIEHLDIALIEPDKTWEVEIKDYTDYKPIEQDIEIPFEKNKAGVCIVNVSSEDYEASTLLIRSDLDLIMKSSRREALVFVEDMATGKPANGVKLLFSDGKKIIGTGTIKKDGVLTQQFGELKSLNDIRVLAIKDGHMASNLLNLSGLGFSKGLAAKGYLYTDRPAYQPGHTVRLRGIIRDVKDGSYTAPSGEVYEVSVSDSQGRLLWEKEKKLSEYGTFFAEMQLDDRASLGSYTLRARAKDKENIIYVSTFQVAKYQLEKIKLKLESNQPIYFRGEEVELTIKAQYYWGQPLADKELHYYLPDGRHLTGKTNNKGELVVKFDTSGIRTGTFMAFRVAIEGENVSASHLAMLAHQGYSIKVSTSQPLVLSGEPFDVSIETKTPDGKPAGREVTLFVLRRQTPKAEPVLNAVPWLRGLAQRSSSEVTVEEKTVTTDKKTGKATVNLELEKGGRYILRVSGEDRFEQVVTGEQVVTISDDEDATKLRFFAETDTLQVGGQAKLRLHSRLDDQLALLTFEGEEILSYQVITLKQGFNPIAQKISHRHFPNFRVSVAVMDERTLRTAAKPFSVERQLKVTLKPEKKIYEPGAQAKVEINVTDQLGKPVQGEFSLALVDEALLSVYPESTPKILSFFQQDAYRHAEFRLQSTCAFGYRGKTTKIIKVFKNEQERLVREQQEGRKIAQLEEFSKRLMAENELEKNDDVANKAAEVAQQAAAQAGQAFGAGTPGVFSNNTLGFNTIGPMTGLPIDGRAGRANFDSAVLAKGQSISGRLNTSSRFSRVIGDKESERHQLHLGAPGNVIISLSEKHAGELQRMNGLAVNIEGAVFFQDPGDKDGQRARQEVAGAGYWLPAIVTDKKGKASVEVPMPESTTQWRLIARGCTVQTLVGEAKANVITRKDFFVNIKAPKAFQEGDSAGILARVHNLTDYEGPVDLTLKVYSGEDFQDTLIESTQRVQIKKEGNAEALFKSFEIPLKAALKIEVSAKAGDHADTLARTVPVRPWGLEFADHGGGVASGDAGVVVELPPDRRDGSQWMTINVGPDLKRSVIDMALGGGVWAPEPKVLNRAFLCLPPYRAGGFAGSDLLAVTAALEFARKVNAPQADQERLVRRTRALVSSLVVSSHKDGGWVWKRRSGDSQWSVSAMSFWALAEAKKLGIPVHEETLKKGETYLKGMFTKVGANDNDAKALILFALSANGAAEFALANRLHRERNTLSAPALAYTAMTLVNLKREEFASELIDVLEKKMKGEKLSNNRSVISWGGTSNAAWVNDRVETTALAALAMMKVRPASPRIKQAVDYLLNRRGAYGFSTAKARGPAVAALAAYYAKGKFAQADYKLTVHVNGRELTSIAAVGEQPTITIAVPHDMMNEGRNFVEFRLNGRGEYAYAVTLRGFTRNLKDAESWPYPYVHGRKYYHRTLEYRGRSIGVNSTSPVQNIEIGQRVRVHVDINHYSVPKTHRGYLVVEEHLPAGMMLADGSLKGSHVHHEIDTGRITMYYPAGKYTGDFSYELIGYASGKYRILPTIIRDAVDTGKLRIGKEAELTVLRPDAKSPDKYVMNKSELYQLGQLHFKDRLYARALGHLSELFKQDSKYSEREVARMLLWIYSSKGFYDAKQIISAFEILRERYPDLELPYEKILVVGKAYRDLAEYERAYLVFKATIDSSFINDINVSAVLEDQGQFLGSIDYQEDLWREYPNTAEVASMYFSVSQALYLKSSKAAELAKRERQLAIMRGGKEVRQGRHPDKVEMLKETIRILNSFMALYPENPLCDDAAFSMANASLDLKQYDAVVNLSGKFKERFPKSEFASGFQYMIALGHFSKHNHPEALKAAKVVATGESKDKNYAEYIVGQIYHAEGSPAEAIDWYGKVKEKYPDARQAIDYFQKKNIKLEEVNIFRPGKPVEIKIKYRNIKEAFMQVYKVDLMKLYLREKNLSKITQVNLAGIKPLLENTVALGDGKDYIDKEKLSKLTLKEEGAYLVICRGDDLFTSALALITPLKIEVQENPNSGRVRANVMDAVGNKYLAGVHVKAVGSADAQFRSGETDLRGIYIADNVHGKTTIIARDDQSRYAFYRGTSWLGTPEVTVTSPRPSSAPKPKTPAKNAGKLNYQLNLQFQNDAIQKDNWRSYDQLRRGTNRGVQIQQVK